MILILMSINYLVSLPQEQEADEAEKLREEIDRLPTPISSRSVFNDFLARNLKARKVPVSRGCRRHSSE